MSNPTIIRLSVTKEVSNALSVAKKRYPTLSDPEILKLGLSRIVTDNDLHSDHYNQIRSGASYAVGLNYLSDTLEDIYDTNSGKKVHF